ncbi:thioredoxin family protein [Aequorivita marina]|uniref:thioredoxin family protein n=1 Tax=Aequorivita marina TaxID=3073654 RepID=UPI00287556FD|nr:thioredoxin family protein [Aequorivita sp. S2608]MDS1299418.1 thioredoxin family protein [Aequorivita sp. S2608]
MSTEIKILQSSCCSDGSPIKKQLENIAKDNDLELHIEELSDMQDTMAYGTMSFPSLVVNDKIYDFKKLKSDDDILAIIKTA